MEWSDARDDAALFLLAALYLRLWLVVQGQSGFVTGSASIEYSH